jgi:UDPglucose 6-dehydrogenase
VNKIKRICPPPSVIGIYRLSMKHDSENFRTSAILDIISMLVENNYKVIIYEPTLDDLYYMGAEVITSFDEFKEISSLIIANRLSEEISKESYKVLSRDLFNKN